MDTSKQYIEMCNCPEIQGDRDGNSQATEWREGDYLCQPTIGGATNDKVFTEYEWAREPWFGTYLWLPRQDQLQEMLHKEFVLQLIDLQDMVEEGRWHDVDSMEQLWLAFVMKEKHGKTWNGTEWHNGN